MEDRTYLESNLRKPGMIGLAFLTALTSIVAFNYEIKSRYQEKKESNPTKIIEESQTISRYFTEDLYSIRTGYTLDKVVEFV